MASAMAPITGFAVLALIHFSGAFATPSECQGLAPGTYCVGPSDWGLNHTILHCPTGLREKCVDGFYCALGEQDPPGKAKCRIMAQLRAPVVQFDGTSDERRVVKSLSSNSILTVSVKSRHGTGFEWFEDSARAGSSQYALRYMGTNTTPPDVPRKGEVSWQNFYYLAVAVTNAPSEIVLERVRPWERSNPMAPRTFANVTVEKVEHGSALATAPECQRFAPGTYCVGPRSPDWNLNHTILHCPTGLRETCAPGFYCVAGEKDSAGNAKCQQSQVKADKAAIVV